MTRKMTVGICFISAVTITIILSFIFAANFPRFETAPPRFALADSDLQNLGTLHIKDLVALRVIRGDLSDWTIIAIGTLVWLPCLIGFGTFLILMLLYKNLPADVLRLGIFVLIGIAAIWWLGWIGFGSIVVLVAVIFPFIAIRTLPAEKRDARVWRRALHITLVTFLFFTATALSLTTHLLLTSYAGFRPASQVEPRELRLLFDRLTHESVPVGVNDAMSWRINQIPSLNTTTQPMTIFAVNYLSAKGFIAAAVLYLVVVWVIIIPAEKSAPVIQVVSQPQAEHNMGEGTESALSDPSRSEGVADDSEADTSPKGKHAPIRALAQMTSERGPLDISHYVRVLFAIPFYLAVGVGCAIMFFNIYIAAAAKQNVMSLYADFMQLSDDEYNQLIAAKERFGPTESLMRRMLEAAREPTSPDISAALHAARARYWPSAVVAQELPRVNTTGAAETQMMLDPQITFTDMLYFSFVSFTTTGYGDIRAISDELRFWTICENIIEVLFTAMFFLVAMERRDPPSIVVIQERAKTNA